MFKNIKETPNRLNNIPLDEYYSYKSKLNIKKEQKFNLIPLIYSILIYLLIPLAITSLTMPLIIMLFGMDNAVSSSIKITVLAQVLVMFIYFKWINKTGMPIFNRSTYSLKDGLIIGLFVPLTLFMPNIIFSINEFFTKVPIETTQNQVTLENLFLGQPLPIIFLQVVIAAPIVEEIIFRGFFLFTTKGSKITWIRIIISSVIFGSLHMPSDLVSLLAYSSMGLLLALVVKYTNKLESSIIVHTVNNLLSFIVMFM